MPARIRFPKALTSVDHAMASYCSREALLGAYTWVLLTKSTIFRAVPPRGHRHPIAVGARCLGFLWRLIADAGTKIPSDAADAGSRAAPASRFFALLGQH